MRRIIERFGLLPLVALAICALAVALQGLTTLPWSYSWLRPLEILERVARREGFPALFALAVALGAASRLSRAELWGLPVSSRSWLSQLGKLEGWAALRFLLPACCLLASAWLLSTTYGALDYLALGLLGLALSARPPRTADLQRGALEALLVLAIFALVSYSFTVIKACVFFHGPPHDAAVIGFETRLFGIAPHRALAAWSSHQPRLVELLDRIYYKLFDHMALVSVFLSAAGRKRERVEYSSALALCYVLGGLSYHLFPVLGPAFAEPGYFAALRQQDLITNYFQAALLETTHAARAGSLSELNSYDFIAAFPSLHIAHELVMLYYARNSRIFLALSAAFTALTLLAVVVLGWHYPSDALAGAALAAIAIAVSRRARGVLLPRAVMPRGPD
jgi:hypothetical protein